MQNMLNLEANGLQQQMIAHASTSVNQAQEYEATVGTGALKLHC